MTTIDLSASEKVITNILTLAKCQKDIEAVSEPVNLDASRPLNAGIPYADLAIALSSITLIFKTATAGLAFLKALREELKAYGETVNLSDPVSGKALGQVKADTPDKALADMTSP